MELLVQNIDVFPSTEYWRCY